MTRSRRYIAIFVFFVVIAIFPQTIFATKKICEECTAADACTGSLKCVDNNGKLVGGATKGTCGDLCPAGTICFRNPACVSTFSELINKIANFICQSFIKWHSFWTKHSASNNNICLAINNWFN